jgi:hypothetical protein
MTRKPKRKMSLQEACDLMTDMGMDDLSDGAYWAIAHDLAEAEYGCVWHELDSYPKEKKERKID